MWKKGFTVLWITILTLNVTLITAEVPESAQLSAPATSTGGGCYGSSAFMMTQYYNPGISAFEYFAYRGGSRFRYDPQSGNIGCDSPTDVVSTGIIYGYETYISYFGNPISDLMQIEARTLEYLGKLVGAEHALAQLNRDDSFLYLQRLIAGKASEPTVVIVVLDEYYISEDIRSVIPDYPIGVHAAHFVVVTGYDSEYIYANIGFEIFGDAVKDLPIPIDHFLTAWNETTRPEMAAQWGPCFMLWQRQVAGKKSVEEDMAHLKNMSKYAVANIRRFADDLASNETVIFNREGRQVVFAPSECVYLSNRMVTFRSSLVEFLEQQNLDDVASKYDEATTVWENFSECTTIDEVVQRLRDAADLEEEAQALWGVEPSEMTLDKVMQEINLAVAEHDTAQQEGRHEGLGEVGLLLDQAEEAIYNEDYDTAYEFAKQAKERAETATTPAPPGGIPGFPIEGILLGLAIASFTIFLMRKRIQYLGF